MPSSPQGRQPAQCPTVQAWLVPPRRWRAAVCYVHQSRVALKGTPSELYFTLQHFKAQRGRARGDLPALVHDLGLEQGVLNQPWAQLSVGGWNGAASRWAGESGQPAEMMVEELAEARAQVWL